MKVITLLSVFFMACSEDPKENNPPNNEVPVALITSPADGETVLNPITLQGTGSDANHDLEELIGIWYLGDDVLCEGSPPEGDGTFECEVTLELGSADIRFEVVDPESDRSSASIALVVSEILPPEVEIISPVASGLYYNDHPVALSALISDFEDDPTDLAYLWSSDVDGDLTPSEPADSNGNIESELLLSEGPHTLTLMVTDTDDMSTSAQVEITVGPANIIPMCSITSPEANGFFNPGDEIVFTGTATDDNIPNTNISIEWTSDLDGLLNGAPPSELGELSFSTLDLSSGVHSVSLLVSDEVSATCEASTTLTLSDAPVVVINSPLDSSVFNYGDVIDFSATVSDTEDTPESIMVTWESDIDGILTSSNPDSSGELSFNFDTLLYGMHSISATATDSTDVSTTVSVSIRINTPPTVPTVELTPEPATTIDDLVVLASGSQDIDGDAFTYTYEWYLNGVVDPTQISDTLPSSATASGEEWTSRVTPNDGYIDGAYVEASIIISNTSPVADSITIDPSTNVFNDSIVTCSAIGSDVDQSITASYLWTINNVDFIGNTLDLSTTTAMPEDTVVCKATFVDDDGLSAEIESEITLANRAPIVTDVIIDNQSPLTNSTLTCTGTVEDPDNETPTESVSWQVSSVQIASGPTIDLDNSMLNVGDTLDCIITATDSYSESGQNNAFVLIGNQDPSIDTIDISPVDPLISDTLICSVSGSDPDNDSTSFTFSWSNVNTGDVYQSTVETVDSASLDLSVYTVSTLDEITCDVVIEDSNNGTSSDSISAIISNSDPTIDSVAVISPNTGVYTGTELTCSAQFSDLEDGSLIPTYEWVVGIFELSGDTFTPSMINSNVGDEVTCTATVSDSQGVTLSSTSSVTIENTIPTITDVEIIPDVNVWNDTTLTCTATVTDPDEDLSISYIWSHNGSQIGTGPTQETYSTMPGDTVTCEASTLDSNSGTASESTFVTISNRAPTISFIEPNDNELFIFEQEVSINSLCADSDELCSNLTLVYESSVDGVISTQTPDITGNSLFTTSTLSTGVHVITATVTDSSGEIGSDQLTLEINTPPVVSNIAITPNSAVYIDETLTCSATVTDPDESLSPTYSWQINWDVNCTDGCADEVGTGPTFELTSISPSPLDEIYCVASTIDIHGWEDSQFTNIVIDNRDPMVVLTAPADGVVINLGDTVTFESISSDPDVSSDQLAVEYISAKDGSLGVPTELPSSGLNSYDYSSLSPGLHSITAVVRDNHFGQGISVPIGIYINTPPDIPVVSISPNPATTNNDLVVNIDSSSDVDGDTLSPSYSWWINGSLTTNTTDTLASSDTSEGDEVQAQVILFDGYAYGSYGFDIIIISNTPPTVSDIVITSNAGLYNDSILTCSATVSDPDENAISPTILWTNSSNQTFNTNPLDLSTLSAMPNDEYTCSVTATDSNGLSGNTIEASVALENRDPLISLISPIDGSVFDLGDSIHFETVSSDPDQLTETTEVIFSSDINGILNAPVSPSVGAGVSSTSSILDGGAHVISATVEDSHGGTAVETSSIYINTPPTSPSITLGPAPAYTDNALSVSASGSTDIDGDSLTYLYLWFNNGMSTSFTGTSIPSSETTAGETWSVHVSAFDGRVNSDIVIETLTITNTPPVVSGVSISPNTAVTNDMTLTCSANVSDADGLPIITYKWLSNGFEIFQGNTIQLSSGLAMPGEELFCEASVEDSFGATSSDSTSVTIDNRLPSIAFNLPIEATVWTLGESIQFESTSSDADEVVENLSVTFSSDIDGLFSSSSPAPSTGLSTEDTSSLSAGYHTITATVTDSSGESTTDVVEILVNTPPTAPTVAITPNPAYTNNNLTANASGSTDADGNNITYTYSWFKNGNSTSLSGSTISNTETDIGELWTVQVIADDGNDTSPVTEVSMPITNRNPIILAVAITPTTATTSTELTCSINAFELDGEAITESFEWTINSLTVGSGATLQLTPSMSVPNDEVYCYATAEDENGGTTTSSNSLTISNTEPVLSNITFTSTNGGNTYNDEELSCTATFTDLDNDSISVSYSITNLSTGGVLWTWNDSSDPLFLESSFSSPFDVLQCVAVASDGNGGSATGSANLDIFNRDPVVYDTPTVSPQNPTTGDTVECVGSGYDPDDDATTLSYVWFNDTTNAQLSTSSTFTLDSSIVSPTDVINCTFLIMDSHASSSSETSIDLTIANTDPVLTSALTITPSPSAFNDDTLSCTVSSSDFDNDILSTEYLWTNQSSSVLATTSTIVLNSGLVSPTDTLYCSVTVSDTWGGTAEEQQSVSIENRDPSISDVILSPTSAAEGDTLVCSPDATDEDNDSITYSYTWTYALDQSVTLNSTTGNYVVESADAGEEVICIVTVQDPYGASDTLLSNPALIDDPNLVVSGTTLSLTEGIYTYDTVQVISGGLLDITGNVVFVVTDFSVDATSLIDGSSGAENGGLANSAASGDGGGGGSTNAGSGGGGYGGNGGKGGHDSSDIIGLGGSLFGSETAESISIGGGAGGVSCGVGGSGGASLSIYASGTVELSGEIDLSGGNGVFCGAGRAPGGGAGGGFMAVANSTSATFSLLGNISVSGGSGGTCTSTSCDGGGGGAGGRIKILDFYGNASVTGTYDISPGGGTPYGDSSFGVDGEVGTYYLESYAGTVMKTDFTWLDVTFEECTQPCTAAEAKNACVSKGKKVVSHASNGSSEVESLGATNSCNFSVSYFTTDEVMPSDSCLAGISNLDWSGCCNTSRWHGNTIAWGATPGDEFGYVNSSNSGFSPVYPNVSGNNWGCQDLGTPADACDTLYVACVD